MLDTEWNSENLRYLLWRDYSDREQWASLVAAWLEVSHVRAIALLLGASLSHGEIQLLALHSGRDADEIQYSRLVAQERSEKIMCENLRYLFATAEAKKQDIALALDVHRTRIPGWLSGKTAPTPANVARIVRLFALPPEADLDTDPLFLSWLPVSDTQRRAWLTRQIRQLRPETLRELFPALERLLREP